jgi:UDP-GlcNAc:undecaprenyl-phosphate GlcNAc-1-phosphate transferase
MKIHYSRMPSTQRIYNVWLQAKLTELATSALCELRINAARKEIHPRVNWLESILLFLVALVVTIALTPVARRLAIRFDAIDYPSARRVNMQPVPRMGGVAIFGGIIAAVAVAIIGVFNWGWDTPLQDGLGTDVNYFGVGVGVLVIFLVGILDDIFSLKPKTKLIGQIIAACIVAGSGLLFSSIHNFVDDGYFEFGLLAYPLTVFYLVAFANIINLIDGLDGLAAGITALTAATIGVLAVVTGRPGAALSSFIIVGACIGFLRYNIHPASIFMGDSGALLLGFLLGIVSLMAVARSAFFVSLLVPILAAGVPILDTAIAIIRRKRAHQPIDEADSGHIHHRLLQAGFSQRTTVFIMWAWTALLSVGAILVTELDGIPRYAVFVILALVTAVIVAKLHLLEPVLLHHFNPRQKPKRNSKNKERD